MFGVAHCELHESGINCACAMRGFVLLFLAGERLDLDSMSCSFPLALLKSFIVLEFVFFL